MPIEEVRRVAGPARSAHHALVALSVALCAAACSGGLASLPPTGDAADAGPIDGSQPDLAAAAEAGAGDAASRATDGASASTDAGSDAGTDGGTRPECEWGGAPGTCMKATACAAIADHSSETGTCAVGLGCCIVTPSLADNPPFPTGYKLMMQSEVTTAMTSWAVMILHDHVTYPMYSTTTMTFGTLMVLASVQWHPPDFQNAVIHRGVTLFEPK